jgi:endonuclease-3
MTLKARYEAILGYFENHIPEAETELLYDNPYQLLVGLYYRPNAPTSG